MFKYSDIRMPKQHAFPLHCSRGQRMPTPQYIMWVTSFSLALQVCDMQRAEVWYWWSEGLSFCSEHETQPAAQLRPGCQSCCPRGSNQGRPWVLRLHGPVKWKVSSRAMRRSQYLHQVVVVVVRGRQWLWQPSCEWLFPSSPLTRVLSQRPYIVEENTAQWGSKWPSFFSVFRFGIWSSQVTLSLYSSLFYFRFSLSPHLTPGDGPEGFLFFAVLYELVVV